MEDIQKILEEKGFIAENGEADINALNALSAETTTEFVKELYRHMDGEKIEALTDIYRHFAFLFNDGKDDEAIRFYYILVDVTGLGVVFDIELAGDVELVLSSDITKRSYLYELLADFHELVEDLRIEAGFESYEDSETQTIEYGSAVPVL